MMRHLVTLCSLLLVLSAPEERSSLVLAREAMRAGTPVFTPEHPLNRSLLELKTSPATLENVRSRIPIDWREQRELFGFPPGSRPIDDLLS